MTAAFLAIILLGLPLAAVITIAALPLWRWIEMSFGIESVGHSGPAGWCYLVVYIATVALAGAARLAAGRQARDTREKG